MRFLRLDYGWWVVGAFALLLAIRWRGFRRYAASTSLGLVGRASRASMLRRVPSLALFATLALASLGLMQPVLPFAEAEVKSRGLDLVMVLDLSSSMQEPIGVQAMMRASGPIVEGAPRKPNQPGLKSRLDATKDAIKAFAAHRPEDRLGLVVFSDNAYVVSPLSADHDYLVRYIDMVDAEILKGEGMTALGDGLALANYLLARQNTGSDSDARGRVVVLFTDGENNRGRDPVEVLAQSNTERIHVNIVGVDLETRVRQKPEVERLVASVRGYGGHYFDANTIADLNEASRIIDGLEKGVVTSKVYMRDVPVFHWFVLPALICLALTLALCTIPQLTDLT